MAKKKRDYQAEYRRRIIRGKAKGLTNTQARGHPKPNEKSRRKRRGKAADADQRLQFALRLIRDGKSPTTAAKEAHVAPERLRRLAKSKRIVKSGKRWRLRKGLSRKVLIYSEGRELTIEVSETMATRVGRYMAGVRWFVTTNKIAHIKPFVGKSITDIDGKRHPFEERPNVLHRLAHTASETFEQVYRIVL